MPINVPAPWARFSHWTPRYAIDRIRLFAQTLTHPGSPWLVPHAVRFLDTWLQANHTGFEWGAGRSTVWFSRRVARLTSIEHDETWYQRMQQVLYAQHRKNVDIRHVPVADANESAYVDAIASVSDATLDFVLVDGVSRLRDVCALAAIPKIRPGAILIIDDVQRYLPSNSRSPLALPPHAKPLTSEWGSVIRQLETWDRHSFTSGVTDTGIWIRG